MIGRLERHTLGVLGLFLTSVTLIAALAAPLIAPHDPVKSDFVASLKPPGTPGHVLGTDQLGRDLYSRVLYGARIALFIGFCTVLLTAVVGGLLGLVAGFFGGWPETVLMRIADVQLSFPFVLLALTINAIVGLGLRNIIISLSAAGWVVYARVVRGEVLSVKQRDFVQAAAALGTGRSRVLFRHVLPNVAPSIIVVASLQFSQFIVAEAAISFLGFRRPAAHARLGQHALGEPRFPLRRVVAGRLPRHGPGPHRARHQPGRGLAARRARPQAARVARRGHCRGTSPLTSVAGALT
jgi:peptide/nickel transport system permease protein